jgi:SAM-dependent methyltransferase
VTLTIFASEPNQVLSDLERRMAHFYQTYDSYDAFQSVSDGGDLRYLIYDDIRERTANGRSCRVLEFGAGRSGFARELGDLRPHVEMTFQDVTDQNREHLAQEGDRVIIGDLLDETGEYDIIFSSYVFEHVSHPRRLLDHVFQLLSPGGKLFLCCPRYDFPNYLSHSADHYTSVKRMGIAAWLMMRRGYTMLTGRPAFLVHLDPAVLSIDWTPDRDAIHWVSQHDIKAHFRNRAQVTRLRVPTKNWKRELLDRYCKLLVSIEKPHDAAKLSQRTT